MSCDAMNVMKLWTEYDAFYHMWDIRSDEYYFIKLIKQIVLQPKWNMEL